MAHSNMNEGEIENHLLQLAYTQASLGVLVSILAKSHSALVRMICEIPELPVTRRESLLESMAAEGQAFEQLEQTARSAQQAVKRECQRAQQQKSEPTPPNI